LQLQLVAPAFTFSKGTRMKSSWGAFLLACAAVFAIACGDSDTTATTGPTGPAMTGPAATGPTDPNGAPSGQAVIGSSQEPGHLNPLLVLPHHFPVHAPYTLIFDSLIQITPDGDFEPRLAADWDIADDNLSVTFNLHADARFHDGTPVTAQDVVFSFDLMMDPDLTTSKDGTAAIDSVAAEGDLTVVFTLSQPDPRFLPVAGSRAIVPMHILEGANIETHGFNRDPVGSGPFKFVSWSSGTEIVMEANADYHLGAPGLERIVFRIVPDQTALVAQLRNGDLDYGLVDPRDYTVVAGFDNLEIVENTSPRYYSMGLNLGMPIFQDDAVRTALMLATPREELVENVLEGRGTVVHTNATPASWAFNGAVPTYEYDLDAARQTLLDAGWEPGSDGVMTRDGERLAFTVTYIFTESQTEQALVIIQDRYERIGVRVQLEGVEGGELLGRRWPAGDFEVSFQLWNPVYDPDQSSTFRTGGGYNGTGYANPEVDARFDEALSTFDIERRRQLYGEIQVTLADHLPMIWLYSNNEVNVISTRLNGFVPHPINNFWNIRQWTVQ
jgi:peptide/nickel transport system substrate-binding protein